MDGIHPGTVAVATAKAQTALFYNRPTEELAAGLSNGNMALLSLPNLLALPGGIPIAGKHGAGGAVGVSGASPDVDEAIARAGVGAIFGG
jgi:glc operon protein GlcG